MDPAALAFSTIYNGFKNNDYQTATISVTGTVPAGSSTTFSATFNLARDQSVAQIYFSTDRNAENLYVSGETYLLPIILNYDNGTTASNPGTTVYNVQFFTQFTATQLTVTARVLNPSLETLSSIDAVYSLKVFTFIAPFAG